jgi:thiamine-monophosphate kinase
LPDEYDVIRIILETVGQPPSSYLKIGDDVAVLPQGEGDLVAKTDMLVRKTDVPKGMKMRQMARKSVVACVSDFAAKGVQPQAALLSLALPSSITRKEVSEMAKGFKEAHDEFSFNIVGGDTNEADDIIIDCCMLGFAEKITERQGAAPGDRVIVTGPFGYQPVGLKVLQENLKIPEKIRKLAVLSVLHPAPRLRLGIELTAEELLSSSIDSSDGLALSLHQLANASEVGFEISRLPIDPKLNETVEKIGLNLDEVVLYGGEEYEIVATVPEKKMKRARRTAEKLGQRIIEIGKVTSEAGQVRFRGNSRSFKIERRGWVHLGS